MDIAGGLVHTHLRAHDIDTDGIHGIQRADRVTISEGPDVRVRHSSRVPVPDDRVLRDQHLSVFRY